MPMQLPGPYLIDCPLCAALHDVSSALTGDIILCQCGIHLQVIHGGNGRSSLEAIEDVTELTQLDTTKTEHLIEALRRACVMGQRHGAESKKRASPNEVRKACGVTSWRGGASVQFSDQLQALHVAYTGAYQNGAAIE